MSNIPSILSNVIGIIGKLTKRDIYRGSALFGIMLYLYVSDSTGFGVVSYMISLMLVISLVAHFVRRIIFPYLELGEIANRADESPIGAAMVFVGICFIIGCLILSIGGMLS